MLPDGTRLIGIDHHGGHGGRPGQQRNGQRHDGNAVALGGLFDAGCQSGIVGALFGRACVEHVHRADQQQQTAADLKALQRDIEELQNLQPQQGADRNHAERCKGGGANGLPALLGVEAGRVVDEEWDDGQRVDDGDQGDQRLDIHYSSSPGMRGFLRLSAFCGAGIAGINTPVKKWPNHRRGISHYSIAGDRVADFPFEPC